MPFVCLSVCLSDYQQLYVKATDRIFSNVLSQMYLYTRNNGLYLGNHSPRDLDQVFFQKYSSTLRDTTFLHNLAHISGQNDRILMKLLLQMCPWTRKCLIQTPDPDHIRLDGRTRSLTALVFNRWETLQIFVSGATACMYYTLTG